MADSLYRRLSCAGCSSVFESVINPRGGVRKKCDECLPDLAHKARCSVDGCGEPSKCKGMCERHYSVSTYKSAAKQPAQKVCAECGAGFSTQQPAATFCSKTCKLKRWRAENPLRAKELHRSSKKRQQLKAPPKFSAYIAKLCAACGKHWGARREWSECGACQREKSLAAIRIASRALAEAKHKAAGKVVACDECGSEFCPLYGCKHGAVPLCSPCATSRKNEWDKGGTHQSRAKRAGVPYRYFRPTSILARDNWTCQLCGEPTPKELRGTCDPRAPELDHILPIAAGGAHVPENCQCACRECNGAKGANPLWRPTKRVDAMETV